MQNNPAIKWFGDLLPVDGLYPAENVTIYFNRGKSCTGPVSDVVVVYYPRTYLKNKGYKDHPIYELIASKYNRGLFNCSSGNCFSEWMFNDNVKSEPPHDPDTNASLGHGPDEDFECLKAWGFKTPEEEKRAIREFARIRECQWARDLLNVEEELSTCEIKLR